MTDSDLIQELAVRAGVSCEAAQAVLEALEAMASERARSGLSPSGVAPLSFIPSAAEVEALIARAAQHPLGLEFLIHGELGAVAITFGTHAFTVDAARRQLGQG
jgi:hypothetical protein